MDASVRVPGSKSETNRALLLAALANGPSRLRGALVSRDSDLMRAALAQFGVEVDTSEETWTITPPATLTVPKQPIDCGLAGTVMRFIPPLAALTGGTVVVTGDEEAFARPMAPVLQGLRQLGCEIDSDHLPLTLTAPDELGGPRVEIDSSASSQFISALLLCAPRFPHGIEVVHTGEQMPSIPPIEMSVEMLRERGVEASRSGERRWQVLPGPVQARDSVVEPDLTGASVFVAAAALAGGEVTIADWPSETTQSGALLLGVLDQMGVEHELSSDGLVVRAGAPLRAATIDLRNAADLTPVVAAMAVFAEGTTTITGVAHIRGHETDRLAALATEFSRMGVDITETDDGLRIEGCGPDGTGLTGGEFRTYADHRMAHAGALAGLVVDDVVLDDVTCTSKTMPTFPTLWRDLVGDQA
nr:3-phosphoshikimate 1-carboxyvinyltransferase [Aestuariimicrobium ganziense]